MHTSPASDEYFIAETLRLAKKTQPKRVLKALRSMSILSHVLTTEERHRVLMQLFRQESNVLFVQYLIQTQKFTGVE